MEHYAVLMAVGVLVLGPLLAAARSLVVTDNEVDIDDSDLIDLSGSGQHLLRQPDIDVTGGHGLVSSNNAAELARNPEEEGNYFEGDIFNPPGQNASLRNGILQQSSHWPGAVVPFVIVGQFAESELAVIRHAFNEYHTKTCVRFIAHTKETDYIAIGNGKTGCWSSVGRLGGRQEVNLQSPNCLRKYGTAQHELMHSLGFFHEQNRHERDNYVAVRYENVKPGMLVNFEKAAPWITDGFGVAYDYASVMHYSATGFSRNGRPTLVALKKTNESQMMGQRIGLSAGDVSKINAMYRCW